MQTTVRATLDTIGQTTWIIASFGTSRSDRRHQTRRVADRSLRTRRSPMPASDEPPETLTATGGNEPRRRRTRVVVPRAQEWERLHLRACPRMSSWITRTGHRPVSKCRARVGKRWHDTRCACHRSRLFVPIKASHGRFLIDSVQVFAKHPLLRRPATFFYRNSCPVKSDSVRPRLR